MTIRMSMEEVMTTPRLSSDEYGNLVESWNKRVQRGVVPEPCAKHYWVRIPHDRDAEPLMICVTCMRKMTPSVNQK